MSILFSNILSLPISCHMGENSVSTEDKLQLHRLVESHMLDPMLLKVISVDGALP